MRIIDQTGGLITTKTAPFTIEGAVIFVLKAWNKPKDREMHYFFECKLAMNDSPLRVCCELNVPVYMDENVNKAFQRALSAYQQPITHNLPKAFEPKHLKTYV